MFQKKYWIYPVFTAAVIGLTGCGNTTESSFNTEESVPQAVKVEQVTEEEPVQVENTESTDDSQEDVSQEYTLTAIESLPEGQFQAERAFPDQNGYVDNTLAMNSMYSFEAFSGHGFLYFDVAKEIERFELFVNNHEVDTSGITPGFYELDISELAVNGTNTIQVSGVIANDPNGKVTVKIPYPTVIDGTLADVGIDEEPLKLIDAIVRADVENGFPSAQLAIVKDGRLVYQNAWGNTNDTLYDLASNTKMYATAYAVQYLIDKGELALDTRVSDVLGSEFADDTIEIRFAQFGDDYPGADTIRQWKAGITVKDLLMHQAGFPDSGHYHNDYFDQANQKLVFDVENVLYVESGDKDRTYREGICRTPLIYKPRTKTMYSDIDYMLLGIIVEEVTGKDLNTFLKDTFWDPMGLTHITYCPTENGFTKDECAATELNGNTRDGLVDFPGVRTETIQGEVHDEECYYMMEGISGHAGLFANATDLAKLASVMLTGGYGENYFFSKNTRDLFISPQAGANVNYGIGWWREADDKRVWYFGTQAPESTVGHQGFSGTLTMIDFENNMVVVFLTNAINSPIFEPVAIENANQFSGKYYTTGTLGFVPQILYTGIGSNESPDKALDALIGDMVASKQKLVDKAAADKGRVLDDEHPLMKGLKAIKQAEKYYKEN